MGSRCASGPERASVNNNSISCSPKRTLWPDLLIIKTTNYPISLLKWLCCGVEWAVNSIFFEGLVSLENQGEKKNLMNIWPVMDGESFWSALTRVSVFS